MAGALNGQGVSDKILEQGMKATESTVYFWGNLTKIIQDTGKGTLTMDSGKKAGTDIFKASKDFARGDTVCSGLFTLSAGCEVASGVLIWVPIPSKITIVAVLKSTSIGCQRFRDLCAQDSSSPLC